MRLIDNTFFVCNLRINLNICQNERKIDFKEEENYFRPQGYFITRPSAGIHQKFSLKVRVDVWRQSGKNFGEIWLSLSTLVVGVSLSRLTEPKSGLSRGKANKRTNS